MRDLRPVLRIVGVLLTTLAIAMVVPAIADATVGNRDWEVFSVSAAFTLFVGGALTLSNRGEGDRLSIRQAFVLTTVSWLVIAIFAALPFAFSDLDLSYTDAFFEAMSGITTTGSTVITGLDFAPPGILLWRALLQWMGGIGIIVVAIAVLPILRIGGMQIFRMESSDTSEKVLPRVTQIATGIAVIYVILTLICAALYWTAGMTAFQAMCHAMTTIATGGFSTSDSSIALFDNAAIDWISVVFMILGGMPFVLFLQLVRGKPGLLFQDDQVRWFLAIVTGAVLMLAGWLWLENGAEPMSALRYAAFNVVSIITGTGFATDDFASWGGFAVATFFLLMFIGGCAGSTSCGIKVFRFQVLYATAKIQMLRLLQPHGVFIPYYNRQPIPDTVAASVMGFFFLFVVSFAILAMALGLMGLDFLTSVSGAATAIANVGPGLGDVIGPVGTFAPLPDAAKWLLSAGMLLGRLELFTVLILFVPAFWRD
jgi:trk system potassium uptake protein TrkH